MYVGIDLGGTNIKGGIVLENGKIIHKEMIPTGAGRAAEEIIRDIAGLVNKMLEDAKVNISEIKCIGIGTPGICDSKNGVVIYASNIGFKNINMRNEMKKYFDIPVFVENDANCAALGEYSVLDEDIENMVFVTLGTGVGGGLIINRRLYTGKNGTAAEVGHMIIEVDGEECSCGTCGCWEKYASVTALINQTREYAEKNPQSALAKACEGGISGRTAFDAAKSGDAGGASVVKRWIGYVATGIINLINILQPEILMIGGAISKEGDYLLNPILEHQENNAYSQIEGRTKIVTASLGNDAGLIGSAFLGRGVV